MRSIWLASTALLMTTGIALAQSATTASPASTGAISSPQVAPSNATPGNMAPSSSSGSATSLSAASSNGVSSPAPNGATSAPDVSASAASGTAPGKMAPGPNAGTASDQAMNGQAHPWHHHWSQGMRGSMALPQDASATTYLHIAKSAIKYRNLSLADDALSHAETRLLDRSVPQGDIAADNSPSIQSIESARQALHAGNYTQASADTKAAASAVSGM
jgi:hypothetical protein